MILFRYYDKEEKVDRIWYSSSNILYSECDDKLDDFKELRITFKNGDTYVYKKVDVNDYVLFAHGGIDASNGKAFWKIIRPKYEAEKIGKKTLEEVAELMEFYKEKKRKELEGKATEEKTPENEES
jgi:hypothetical protein